MVKQVTYIAKGIGITFLYFLKRTIQVAVNCQQRKTLAKKPLREI